MDKNDYISRKSLREYFTSEESGIDGTIEGLMQKYGLDSLHDVDEDAVMQFARDLLQSFCNVIDTEPAAEVAEVHYAHRGLHLGFKHYCSHCGRLAYMEDNCSRCGAVVKEAPRNETDI